MQDSRHRSTALKHALALEEKKKLKARILDLVLEAYDLPTQAPSTPDKATSSDVRLFKTCLSLFQPSDFDDLVRERNIDDRCGYALCSNPNEKVQGGGNNVWNRKGGKEFQIVDRSELEKWCSQQCAERAGFVRAQLSTEPAWLRDSQNNGIKLLDDMHQTVDLVEALQVSVIWNCDMNTVLITFQELAITGSANEDLNAKLKALSLERGESTVPKTDIIEILEKEPDAGLPPAPASADSGAIEGHKPRQVRFATQTGSDPG